MRCPLPCIGLLATLLGSAAQVAHAAPPDDSMLAPAMQPAPGTLDAALDLDPGASCLARATLLEHVTSWRDQDQDLDPRVAVVVRGDPQNPQRLRFEVLLDGAIAVEREFEAAPDDCA
ncbi:MAG: hypothetical protein KC431_21425, partial [Myxococcales bacterium]|nr:hypothetical protein [Myxococcales bacterium]